MNLLKSKVHDQLMMAPLVGVRSCAFSQIDALQGFVPGVQVAGIAIPFKMLCEVYQQDPREVFALTDRMQQQAEIEGRVEFRAIKAYMEGELNV